MSETFLRTLALHERGDALGAIEGYQTVIRHRDTDMAAAYSNLGMLLGEAGRQAESVHASTAAAELAPHNPAIMYNLGNVRMEARKDAEAAAIFQRVLQLEHDHAPSYHNLGLLSHRSGDLASSLAYFRAALACGAEQLAAIGGAAQVYSNMAVLKLGGSEVAETIAMQRQAIALQPDNAISYVRLAELLLEPPATAESALEAESALSIARKLLPADASTLNALGTLLQSQPGRFQEAAAAYSAAIRSVPSDGGAYHNLGTVHQRLGRLAEARAMYRSALPLLPDIPNVYISLASLSPPAEGARLLAHAISLRPSDVDGYLRLASTLAPLPLGSAPAPDESSTLRALELLDSAVTIAPQDPRLRNARGRLRLLLAASWSKAASEDVAVAARCVLPANVVAG